MFFNLFKKKVSIIPPEKAVVIQELDKYENISKKQSDAILKILSGDYYVAHKPPSGIKRHKTIPESEICNVSEISDNGG